MIINIPTASITIFYLSWFLRWLLCLAVHWMVSMTSMDSSNQPNDLSFYSAHDEWTWIICLWLWSNNAGYEQYIHKGLQFKHKMRYFGFIHQDWCLIGIEAWHCLFLYMVYISLSPTLSFTSSSQIQYDLSMLWGLILSFWCFTCSSIVIYLLSSSRINTLPYLTKRKAFSLGYWSTLVLIASAFAFQNLIGAISLIGQHVGCLVSFWCLKKCLGVLKASFLQSQETPKFRLQGSYLVLILVYNYLVCHWLWTRTCTFRADCFLFGYLLIY